jgi:hypothetical protein
MRPVDPLVLHGHSLAPAHQRELLLLPCVEVELGYGYVNLRQPGVLRITELVLQGEESNQPAVEAIQRCVER